MSGCKTSIKKVKDVSEATGLVLEWFERENKPATPQSLTDALGSRVAKPLIQKILDQLLTDNKLNVKDLKKIRFYYLRPEEETAAFFSEESTAPTPKPLEEKEEANGGDACDTSAAADTDDVIHDVGVAAVALAETHRRLERWQGWPSQVERMAQEAELAREVRELEAELQELQQESNVDADAAQSAEMRTSSARRAVNRYRRARQMWVERKGWAMRLLEASGGDVHGPQHMAELLGCTTDVDAAISFEATAVLLPQQILRDLSLA